MNLSEEITCPFCHAVFYLHSFRLREAKTVGCMGCGKTIIKQDVKCVEDVA